MREAPWGFFSFLLIFFFLFLIFFFFSRPEFKTKPWIVGKKTAGNSASNQGMLGAVSSFTAIFWLKKYHFICKPGASPAEHDDGWACWWTLPGVRSSAGERDLGIIPVMLPSNIRKQQDKHKFATKPPVSWQGHKISFLHPRASWTGWSEFPRLEEGGESHKWPQGTGTLLLTA